MTDRQSTHSQDCWDWGPKHYGCAVREIETLRAKVAKWKFVAAVRTELHEEYESRAERAEARVAELERVVSSVRARIDALKLKYCPDEMTPEQVAEWVRHQRPANPTIVHCDNCGCDWVDNGINPIGCPYCKTASGSINTSANHVRQA